MLCVSDTHALKKNAATTKKEKEKKGRMSGN